MTLVLATRGSPLAMWQAREVKGRLEAVHDGLEVQILEVRTEGDRVQDRPLAEVGTGVFTKEVDARVHSGEAHIAVHSLKDQLSTLPDGIALGMVLPRGPVEDALISTSGLTFATLPTGARIATGSLRRRSQLLRARPDLEAVPIRGNVDTRLGKLDAGEADALILARAGLERLGLGDRITEVIEPSLVLPAVSQGIVGVTCREDDDVTRELLAAADDPSTHSIADAERAWLRRLGGGCNVSAAAHGIMERDGLRIRARVLDQDGRECLEAEREGLAVDAARIGQELADDLIDRGAIELVRGDRR